LTNGPFYIQQYIFLIIIQTLNSFVNNYFNIFLKFP